MFNTMTYETWKQCPAVKTTLLVMIVAPQCGRVAPPTFSRRLACHGIGPPTGPPPITRADNSGPCTA